MRKVILSTIFICLYFIGSSQVVYLDNAEISIQDNASITIQGDLEASTGGTVESSGTVFLRDNLINNSGDILFTNLNNGTVILYGNDQIIQGADSVVFYNLYFDGNPSSEKSFQLSSAILNELDVNNEVLQTNDNRVFLMNPNQNSLFFDQGFIASDDLGGYFVRATNSIGEYLFPVGSVNLTPNTRMLAISPLSSDTNYFEARLSPVGGSIDNSGTSATGASGPFDPDAKEVALGTINDSYYHNIHQLSGTSAADIDLYWNSLDGDFKTLAQWKGGQYFDALPSFETDNAFGLDRRMSLKNFMDYDDDVFVLADLNIVITVPGGVSANDDGFNDDLTIENLNYYPNNSLTIFNRWGDKVFEAAPYENNWSGQNNVGGTLGGSDLPAGTYYYLFQLDEDSEVMKGFIELKK